MGSYQPIENDSDLQRYLDKAPMQFMMATAGVKVPQKDKADSSAPVQTAINGETINDEIREEQKEVIQEMEIREITELENINGTPVEV